MCGREGHAMQEDYTRTESSKYPWRSPSIEETFTEQYTKSPRQCRPRITRPKVDSSALFRRGAALTTAHVDVALSS